MLHYPRLNEIPTSRDLLDKFKGYNHNLRIGEGEFFDMKNLTGDDYPVLSPRKKRGTYLTTNAPSGMCSNTNFCYVDGQDFYIGEKVYDLKLTAEKEGKTKELISMGSNVIVMPDHKYINTVNTADRGNLRNGVYEIPEKNPETPEIAPRVRVTVVGKMGATSDDNYYTINGYPTTGGEYELYIDGNKDGLTGDIFAEGDHPALMLAWYKDSNPLLSRYRWGHTKRNYSTNEYTYEWGSGTSIGLDGNFVTIGIYTEDDDQAYFDGVMENISKAEGDVTISGLPFDLKGEVLATTFYDYETLAGAERKGLVIRAARTDFITTQDQEEILKATSVVEWLANGKGRFAQFEPQTIETPVTIEVSGVESTVPKMDFVVEAGNRLWGCRYGENNDGEFVNEIYASELGNFKNWYKFEGISTDSWVGSVGTSGAFTGAINFGGKPIFFKEDCMHRVFGDYPNNFQIQTINCRGVQEGCSKSLAIVNEILYYKSRTGICVYDGSLPVEISSNFGDIPYTNAVAGAIRNKYYVSMKDDEGEYHMFVYDSSKGMWHKEDNTQATQFCNHQGELYYIDHADHYIHTIKGTGVLEDDFKWGAETGILGANTPDNKYVTKIDIRMSMTYGSRVMLSIEYDSTGKWEQLFVMDGLTLTTFTIPVLPQRCDHFRLRFEGYGEAKIYSISKTLEESE